MGINEFMSNEGKESLGINGDMAEVRINICKKCPLYLNRYGGICNSNLWMNPNTGEISTKSKDGYVNGCGCRMENKVKQPESYCIAGKW